MRLKPADTKQDMFVQAHVTFKEEAQCLVTYPHPPHPFKGHQATWLHACGYDPTLWHEDFL